MICHHRSVSYPQDIEESYGNQVREITTDSTLKNIIKDRIISYDKYNRVVAIKEGDKVLEKNSYNYEGLRVQKETQGKKLRYIYDGTNIVLELNEAGVKLARNVFGTKLVSRETGNQKGFYRYNGHGDVIEILDGNGLSLASYYYDSFGNIKEEKGSFDNPYRYAGYVYDKEADYYYLQSRMYDPSEGRFIQEDTFRGKSEDPLSLNLYTYCANNPIVYDDQNGHWFEWVGKAWNGAKSVYNYIDESMENSDDNYDALNKDLGIDNPIVIRDEGIFNGIGKFGWGVVKSVAFIAKTAIDTVGLDGAKIANELGLVNNNTLDGFKKNFESDINIWKQVPGGIVDSAKNIIKNAPRYFTDPNMSVGEVSNLTSDVLNIGFLAEGSVKLAGKVNNIGFDISKFSPGSVVEGVAEPDFGNKLDYIFGKAKGNQHNLDRTAGMESELAKKMGIADTPANREYIMQKIRGSYFDGSSISSIEQMSYVAKELPGKPTINWTGTTRETFITGPDRGAVFQTLWDDNVLKNIIVRGGKGAKPQTIEEILSQIKK